MSGARRALLAAATLAAACHYQREELQTGEVAGVLTGNCAAGETSIGFEPEGPVGVKVTGAAATELPVIGLRKRAGAYLREGGFSLYGTKCPTSEPQCSRPEQFRLCTATRVGFVLDVRCQDGFGRPVCQGTLHE